MEQGREVEVCRDLYPNGMLVSGLTRRVQPGHTDLIADPSSETIFEAALLLVPLLARADILPTPE